MISNASMKALLGMRAYADDSPIVAPADRYVLEDGWTVGPTGALVLSALCPANHPVIPPARLGEVEYEVNDVDITLTDLDRGRDDFLPRAASRCLWVVRTLLNDARDLPRAELLVGTAAVRVDDEDFALQGGNVRFFTRRGSYPDWVFGDLDRFRSEAVAVLDLTDLA